jgi:hypothetical protein
VVESNAYFAGGSLIPGGRITDHVQPAVSGEGRSGGPGSAGP